MSAGLAQAPHEQGDQHVPPARTLKKASMSASVAESPSALKSALLVQGGGGQVPARQRKKASMSASVATSPSQSKSAEPQGGGGLPSRAATCWAVSAPS